MNIGQGPWFIDDQLTFSVTTHNPSTGASAIATGDVTYEVWDQEGSEADNGVMTSWGDGFYLKTFSLPSSTYTEGFSYVIVVVATVAGVTSRISGGFKVSPKLPANAKQINDVPLTGDGDTIPWGPA